MKFRILSALVLSALQLSAQENKVASCAEGKQFHLRALAKTAVASPLEEAYDVKYVKLDVALTNRSIALSGTAQTNAVARVPMSQYVFELNNSLLIDSVKVNGVNRTLTTSGIIRTVSLGASLPAGTAFTAQVWYRGTPTAPSANASVGIYNASSPSWGNAVTYTLSEPYGAKDWWPCKQSLQDKIDSSDVWITVPDSLKAGSNGLLKAVTALSGNRKRYEWQSRASIDHYLISVAVANYVDYSFYARFTGSTDSVLVQNYVYNNPLTLPYFKNAVDSTAMQLDYFSQLFGRYPFWKEKYGHCMAPLDGGMEHQTMSTMANFSGILVPHELAHQWFGDYVTCASWRDIWLNEGFAAYSEYLFNAHFKGTAAARADLISKHSNGRTGVTIVSNGSVYVDDTTDVDRIFSTRLTYNKGASVVHMLRFLAPTDSTFFASLRGYLQHFAYGTATTDSFKAVVQPYYNRSLDTFINEWVYGQGFPVYSARWNAAGGRVYVNLTQQGSAPQSVPVFHYPVQVKLAGFQGDTTIVVDMRSASETVAINWTKPVSGITIDPNEWIPHQIDNVTQDATLAVTTLHPEQTLLVAPNPSHTAWTISGIDQGHWQLLDISGRLLLEGQVEIQSQIPATRLVPGMYQLQIIHNGQTMTQRLVRD
ncbi:MAG: T9SS type A sorting domain-containing protein [Sphingobacteriales bacterium]|nr:MAG: T9SS type A sorting domain-containing protein [Sphingobacteriales bacterium]